MEKGKNKEISNIRLVSQKVEFSEFAKPGEIVSWMGAMQAQDYQMAKWGVGIRISGSTDKSIEDSYNKGEILRTHIMRPTWHFISPEDIYWMLELTAPHIKSSMKSRDKTLELGLSVFIKSNRIIEESLTEGICLTRDELGQKIKEAGIRTDANRLSHLLTSAELDGLICSGPNIGNKHTFCLLNYRVPFKKVLSRDASLAELAKRYFTSHCPATLGDFVWWSGLSAKDARQAWEFIKADFVTESIGTEKYLFPNSLPVSNLSFSSAHLLPAYDEFLISYKNRSASLSLVDNKKTISVNGIFNPVIILNGQVRGIWRRVVKKKLLNIEMITFEQLNKSDISLVTKNAKKLGRFLNKEINIIYR